MKKVLRGIAVLAAAASLALSGGQLAAVGQAQPATAAVVAAKKATPAVTIRTIPTRTVTGSAKTRIAPLVSARKGTKVVSKRLKVVRGRATLARSAASVALKAGTYKVTTTVKYKVGTATQRTTSKTQTLVVRKKAKTAPVSSTRIKNWKCPVGYPVKGNQTGSKKEWKYHVPGGAYYNKTNPEVCFKTTAAARKAGYRASKR